MVMQAQGNVIYSAPRCANYFTTLCGGIQCGCDTVRCGATDLLVEHAGDFAPRRSDPVLAVGPIRLIQA